MTLNSKRTALSRPSRIADTMSLERLIRDGPPDGDVRGALASARLKVLDQGIKSDSDGMVRFLWSYTEIMRLTLPSRELESTFG